MFTILFYILFIQHTRVVKTWTWRVQPCVGSIINRESKFYQILISIYYKKKKLSAIYKMKSDNSVTRFRVRRNTDY